MAFKVRLLRWVEGTFYTLRGESVECGAEPRNDFNGVTGVSQNYFLVRTCIACSHETLRNSSVIYLNFAGVGFYSARIRRWVTVIIIINKHKHKSDDQTKLIASLVIANYKVIIQNYNNFPSIQVSLWVQPRVFVSIYSLNHGKFVI